MNSKEKAIHKNLVKAIKNKIKDVPVDVISEILPLSKESIYRRLRGDVFFTFFEAVIIAQKLQISLDEIVMTQGDFWQTNLDAKTDPLDTQSYHDKLLKWAELLKYYATKSESHMYMTITDQVLLLSASYDDSLIKFSYYQSIFENGGLVKNHTKFSELEIPSTLIEEIKSACDTITHLNMTCIINKDTYSSYLKKVEYMKTLELITEEETYEIKSNLYKSLEHLRDICNTGYTDAGSKFEAYICETNSGSSFGILEDDESSVLFTKLLGLNYITFEDQNIIKTYKQVFSNLKNLSALISGSGSAQRIAFFKEQFAMFE